MRILKTNLQNDFLNYSTYGDCFGNLDEFQIDIKNKENFVKREIISVG